MIRDDHQQRNAQRRQRGQQAEDLALAHLQAHGLTLLMRNYRCSQGEIDLVLMDGATLVLAEVRYRAGCSHGGAAASVTSTKQQRLIRASQRLLMQHPALRHHAARFDVIAIAPGAAQPRIDWIKQAFLC